MGDVGFLTVKTVDSVTGLPVHDALVTIMNKYGLPGCNLSYTTNLAGETDIIRLGENFLPFRDIDGKDKYYIYDIKINHENYYSADIKNVHIYPGKTTLQKVELNAFHKKARLWDKVKFFTIRS